jgi:pilus assembly protein Flp/PilA
MLKLYVSVEAMVRRYLVKDQRGATAIEYGLIAGLIAAILVGILQATGGSLVAIFNKIYTAINTAATT